ncbi:MAG: hypothetical protein IKE59_08225 [Erysipelotrichaceae bacterium]|nr:hypothetical protein [Erysipelotrichaceae bacterium]
MKHHLIYIFVHGLSGWGSYDIQYERMPYWGMRNGDLMKQLKEKGYECYAASVAPHGSAHDRACELYAQLFGEVTDYGEAHAEKYGHARYGKDFRNSPLIPKLKENDKLVFFGHSFGGATIRLFADILANGRKEEGDSPFFRGGKGDLIFALYLLAAPSTGTTAYDMYLDASFHPEDYPFSLKERIASKMMSSNNSAKKEEMNPLDSAAYDMHIDHAIAMNETMALDENVYYFSQPCRITEYQSGIAVPNEKACELLFLRTPKLMGRYTGTTKGGFVIDEKWKANDGLVNTISAMYPYPQKHKPFEKDRIEPGIWNVLETMQCDHMALQGGLTHKSEVLPYYLKALEMMEALKERGENK